MNPFSAINRYVIENGGLYAASTKVARLSCKLLRKNGIAALVSEIGNTLRIRNAQVARINRRNDLLKAASTRSFKILATPHTMYVAHMLDHALTAAGYSVMIATSIPIFRFEDAVYIVICPQMFSRLPRYMISYQMEQSVSPRWFTPRYLKTLRNSLAIFDYSKHNINFLQEQGIPYSSIFHLPIASIPNYLGFLANRGWNLPSEVSKSCDVLFYGDATNERRQLILTELGHRFNLRVIGNVFGQELYLSVLSARVVVNLHYYDNALLETTRIHECLSLGIPVVSEWSQDCEDYPDLLSRVHFVELGNVAQMAEAIEDVLKHKREAITSGPSAGISTASFHVNRFLLANDLMHFDAFTGNYNYQPDLSTGKVCLSLPETVSRRKAFISQGLPEFKIFDGLRHAQGWLGCAMSYKYLIFSADRLGLNQLTICEDDVVIKNEAALPIVDRYLESLDGQWDIFVGLIAHLNSDAEVSAVVESNGLTFVHLNSMTSMVFNIYNRSVFQTISSWNEEEDHPKTNTIDRFLESKSNLRIVTALPFVVGHSSDESSTLWGFGNVQYDELIKNSANDLQKKVKAWQYSVGNQVGS